VDGRASQLDITEWHRWMPTSPAGSKGELAQSGDAADLTERPCAADLTERRCAAPSPFALNHRARPMDKRAEELEVGKKTTIDRLVTELAEAESWERLAQAQADGAPISRRLPART
jgi:hypothetical protein